MCELDKLIKGRRSIRKFKNRDVPNEKVLEVIESARWAPSAGNLQPWRFIIVKSKETKRKLAEAALNQFFIYEAPVVIVLCVDLKVEAYRYGERGVKLYVLVDSGIAIQNMLLKAYSIGLGTCVVGAFRDREVSSILSLPDHIRPVAIIPIGYPDESPAPPPRIPLKELIRYEKW